LPRRLRFLTNGTLMTRDEAMGNASHYALACEKTLSRI